jgi:hypothetical protein
MKDGFSGKRLLLRQNICHALFAAIAIAFSTYLMGLCIRLRISKAACSNVEEYQIDSCGTTSFLLYLAAEITLARSSEEAKNPERDDTPVSLENR